MLPDDFSLDSLSNGQSDEPSLTDQEYDALVGIGRTIAKIAGSSLSSAFERPFEIKDGSIAEVAVEELDIIFTVTGPQLLLESKLVATDGSTHNCMSLVQRDEIRQFLSGAGSSDFLGPLGEISDEIINLVNTDLSKTSGNGVKLSFAGAQEVTLQEGIFAEKLGASRLIQLTHQLFSGSSQIQIVHLISMDYLHALVAPAPDKSAQSDGKSRDDGRAKAQRMIDESFSFEMPPAPPPQSSQTRGSVWGSAHGDSVGFGGGGNGGNGSNGGFGGFGGGNGQNGGSGDGPVIRPAQFAPLAQHESQRGAGNLDLILDVTLQITVELGRTTRAIREILELGPGSVIELDRLAGEPVDILVNDRPIAKGEVVVVEDENFGVRVTNIISPQKRIASLR